MTHWHNDSESATSVPGPVDPEGCCKGKGRHSDYCWTVTQDDLVRAEERHDEWWAES